MRPLLLVALIAAAALAGCTTPEEQRAARESASAVPTSTGTPTANPTGSRQPTTTPTTALPTTARPTTAPRPPRTTPWVVGARALPLRPDGFGEILPTPEVLRDRALPTPDILPPPPGDAYRSTVSPVPADVLARSTWRRECPVTAADLRYLTMSFWGFDGLHHTGEMIVHRRVADDIAAVFGRLHAIGFPIEEMRVTAAPELDLHPTGDGNNTGSFVCRPTVGARTWSAHASGLAIDVNPFHNPYVRGNLVLPELASSYVDRQWRRRGMLYRDDAVVRAFAGIGWSWGGDWRSPLDIQHFTATGR